MFATDFAQVGRNIQNQLVKRNITQQTLADALNVSKQVMSKIINGNKAINVDELGRIASFLNISTDELLARNGNMPQTHNFSFMGRIRNESTRDKIDLIKNVIDEIHLLEELSDE